MLQKLYATNIISLQQLLKFVRERWPDFYRGYHICQDGTGQQAMRRLWADFLGWLDRDNGDRTPLSNFAPPPKQD
jgi:hypothetical protein